MRERERETGRQRQRDRQTDREQRSMQYIDIITVAIIFAVHRHNYGGHNLN